MKINQFLFMFLLILSIGCKENTGNSTEQNNVHETPEVLEDHVKNEIYGSLSKRYSKNVIEQLYGEALEKDKKLKLLDKKIRHVISDSLEQKIESYRVYNDVNREYWNSAKNYAKTINDSLVKKSVIEIFDQLEKRYDKRVSAHEEKMDEIDKKILELNTQKALMKLFITAPMIENYQKNELPDIGELESLIEDYKEIIEETKDYTTFK